MKLILRFKLLSPLKSGGEEDLLSSLGTEVLGLALLQGLHLGAVLDRLSVGQLSGADEEVEVLRLESLDSVEIVRGGELPAGHSAEEPPHTLQVLQLRHVLVDLLLLIIKKSKCKI